MSVEKLHLAMDIAKDAHEGQTDRGGQPYILHPYHIMSRFMFDPELASIAVLHDVVEDSEWTIDAISESGFSVRVCSAIDLLTHEKGQEYLSGYIEGMCGNYDAVRVKMEDIKHNSDVTRLPKIGSSDLKRLKKYHNAFLRLSDAKARHKALA